MSKHTNGRAAATGAQNTTTTTTTSKRNARAARFKALAAEIVAKTNADNRALLDAAAEAAGMNAADFIAWQVIEERGLGKRRDNEAKFNREIDDRYEEESTLRRRNHEREKIRCLVAMYGMFHAAGLTRAEEVEVVLRFFKKGDRHLAEAEGRAIRCALECERDADANASTNTKASGPDTTRAEIEIAAAARIVGLSADEFITEALQSAINAAKDLNGGELNLTADERAKLDAAKEN